MEEEDNGWVFDSLVCFLNGPVWNAPLESFIEEKSLIFEANVSESPEYQKIFDEFKNLVDFMLGNFMEDIGITPQQFEDACAKGTEDGVSLHFDQNIFEQIWAANDYDMFKRMMTQRNVELQLQALELIEQKYGITPDSFVPHKEERNRGDAGQHSGRTEVEIVANRSSSALEKQIMKEVVKKFPPPDAKSEKDAAQYVVAGRQILESSLKTIATPVVAEAPAAASKSIEEKENVGKSTREQQQKPAVEVDRVDLKKRQEYLRAQRDKLVALKKEARKKQLQVDGGDVVVPERSRARPKSAKKAAESILEGGAAVAIEPQQLQLRKALVEKLKSEVIGGKDEKL